MNKNIEACVRTYGCQQVGLLRWEISKIVNRGGVTVYYAGHGLGVETLCFALNVFTFQLTTYIYFLNPAHRRRDGAKEDNYV